jgi:2-polyprenyl-3-methyl-5-hydroxy-6-metoxy-1,4-benzoquinol methylase
MKNNYKLNNVPNGTHQIIADQIGNSNKLVLDVGCNRGYLNKLTPMNIFYGIDINSADLEVAARSYKKTFKIDLNFSHEEFNETLKFDVIVFADILEHLINPEKVLQFFAGKFLKDDGTIIVSLPNVAHFSVRLNLMFGNFNYTDAGILDKTHLHLYTLETARKLMKECGLDIDMERFSSNNFGWVINLFPFLSTLFGFNLILICRKKY